MSFWDILELNFTKSNEWKLTELTLFIPLHEKNVRHKFDDWDSIGSVYYSTTAYPTNNNLCIFPNIKTKQCYYRLLYTQHNEFYVNFYYVLNTKCRMDSRLQQRCWYTRCSRYFTLWFGHIQIGHRSHYRVWCVALRVLSLAHCPGRNMKLT